MGGQRKPAKLLEASGAYKKNPQRRRGPEPEAKGQVGNAPAHLSELEIQCWQNIVANCPQGVLAAADRQVVELGARLMAQSMTDFENMPATRLSLLNKVLNQLGCSPTGRAGLALPAENPADNPWAQFG